MNSMDLSKKTEDDVQEVITENIDGKEQKSKKALRDLLVVILLFAAFPIVLRGGGAILGIVLAIMVVIAGVIMLPFSATLGLLFAGGLELFWEFVLSRKMVQTVYLRLDWGYYSLD